MTPPAAPRGTPAFPGISEFLAEAPMPGHGLLWQINGCVENADPNDPESWGWLASVSTGFGDAGGDLAKFLALAANAHAPLVEALERIVERGFSAQAEDQARAALKLARGEQ